jgi:spore maturation protein CgeB
MRFLIVTHAYEQFLADFYAGRRGLRDASFRAQRQAYYDTLFGSADFYAHALERLGHDCEEVVYNALPMQRAWLRQYSASPAASEAGSFPEDRPMLASLSELMIRHRHALQRARKAVAESPLRHLKGLARPLLRQLDDAGQFSYRAFLDQVRTIRPDVLYVHSMFAFADDQLRELRKHVGRIVGQHAATALLDGIDYRLYDLVISSFPPTIDYLRARGARAELVRLAFDPRVARLVPEARRDRDVTFSGSLFGVHSSRLALLERVAAGFPQLEVHAAATLPLAAASPLAGRLRPPLWGRPMFELLRRSVAALNHHGDVLPFANNMRLYEATGMGCLLVTDRKDNLGEMFEPDEEVVTYGDAEECVDKLRFYLAPENAAARRSIMRAGERRTLSEHTYEARMREVLAALRA